MHKRILKKEKLAIIFIICCLIIAIIDTSSDYLFIRYLIDWLELSEQAPHIISNLVVLRFFCLATISTTLIALVIFYYLLKPTDNKERSKKVFFNFSYKISLRTKIMLPLVVLFIIPMVTIGIFAVNQLRQFTYNRLSEKITFETKLKAKNIEEILRCLEKDLLFLSQTKTFNQLANTKTSLEIEFTANLDKQLEEEMFLFFKNRKQKYKVFYIDISGKVNIAFNINNNSIKVVTAQQLESINSDFYTFNTKSIENLQHGHIYISSFDLNTEVIQYITPIEDIQKKRSGFIAIVIQTEYLFSIVSENSDLEIWLVDEKGYFIRNKNLFSNKQQTYPTKQKYHISSNPILSNVISTLKKNSNSKLVNFYDCIYSISPIVFYKNLTPNHYALAILYPQNKLQLPLSRITLLVSLSLISFIFITLAAAKVYSSFIANFLSQPIANLRLATKEITSGNLNRSIQILTGDEIEDLAKDFDTMRVSLRQTQTQLSNWNAHLEQEVANRTQDLQNIQSALARVDKLASIGQMTAGIMHEIGNPLAAIKTKIQIAEEETHCEECKILFSELIDEVNRLASFLRSFSRLSRLQAQKLTEISLLEVVNSVITLIEPELRRRGLHLQYQTFKDMFDIKGDANQLRQLLINLILNAADASKPGSEILIRLQTIDNKEIAKVQLEVIDKGIGIGKDIVDKIWNPFFTTKKDGTGLGLGICKKIVEDHEGVIEVESLLEVGTTIKITFPLTYENNIINS